MGGFAGLTSSESREETSISFSDQKIAASDYSTVTQPRASASGKNSNLRQTVASGHGISVGGNGSSVYQTITNNELDGGAIEALRDLSLAQSNLAAGAVKNLTEIAQTHQTDGANVTQKTILYIALGLGALFALMALFKSR